MTLQDKIRRKAQEFYEFRMACGLLKLFDGISWRPYTPQDDWLSAEKEINREIGALTSKEYSEWLNL